MVITERASRFREILRAFEVVGKNAPTMVSKFRDLSEYHPPSRDHVLGVTISLADSAIQLGLDPEIAIVTGFPHDLGKRRVRLKALNGQLPLPMIQQEVREPHMFWTRIALQEAPASEFKPLSKNEAMAISMAHHDILPNRTLSDYYPRHRNPDHPQRFTMPKAIHRWQILLALHDKANRFSHGYDNDRHVTYEAIVADLNTVVSNQILPFSKKEVQTDIETVAHSTSMVNTADLMHAYHALTR